MQSLIDQLLEGESPEGVIDLCLDFSVSSEYTPEKFTELANLAPFVDLEILSIAQHQLEELSGLAGLDKLTSLNLSQNEIEDLSTLPAFPALTELDLGMNLLTSLAGAPDLPQLRDLNLFFNHLESIEGIERFPELEKVVLSGNRPLKDLTSLAECPRLTELYIKQLFIGDYAFLSRMPNLQTLSCNPMRLESLPLDQLSGLTRLQLSAGRMEGVLSFPPLPNLTHLSIVLGKSVHEVKGLEGMPALQELKLNQNGLVKAPDVRQCLNLTDVNLMGNNLNSFDAAGYEHVETVLLGGNPMSHS